MSDLKKNETSIIKPSVKKNNNYFDEEKVTNWIFEYQKTAIIERDSEGNEKVIWKDKHLENLITNEITKIVKAIIQIYRYYIFEPYEDCLQHGLMSCYTNYLKWKPEKGTAFNFFSIISKRSLLNYTERRQKHRNNADISEIVDFQHKEFNFDDFVENLKHNLISTINSNFLGNKRKKYLQIAMVLTEYLNKTKKFISKTDFYSCARTYGIRSIDIREFIKDMTEKEYVFFIMEE